MSDQRGELVSLRAVRERAIAVLGDLFSSDELDVDEFDRRVTVAHRAGSLAEIEALLADFPQRKAELVAVGASAITTPQPTTAMVPSSQAVAEQRLTAILGGTTRHGPWSCPHKLRIVAVMGGVVLDFREARLTAGVTEVNITAIMGGAQIIVPPGLPVDISGTAVMGGFDHVERTPPEADPERPMLRIHGFALMGGVQVETRMPGEGERDAHRRRRHERKALRAAERDSRKQLPAPK